MHRFKLAAALLGVGLIAAVVSGGIGAGMATALVTQLSNDRDRTSPSEAPDTEAHQLRSAVLGEARDVTVHLPDFYARDTGEAYPVLVVLDGDSRAPEAASIARTFARAGLAPGHLVVGVDNVPRGRTQDLLPPGLPEPVDGTTGGADRFLAFLETELLPEIDSLYRTDGTRLLMGHSFGGTFAAYALAERPDLFDGVFALSPSFWVADGAVADRLDSLAASDPPDAVLYLSLGDERGPSRTHFLDLVEGLESRDAAPLRWEADVIEGASHGATPRLTLPRALHAFWHDRGGP